MQTVFFDVDGVLIDGFHFRPELRKCWHKNLQEDFGIDPEEFSNTFFKTPFSSHVLLGKMDLTEALRQHLPSLGYSGDPAGFLRYWLEKDTTLNPGVIDCVKALKESGKARLFIATNQAHDRAEYLMETLGLKNFFEDIFYSARMGMMKPDRAYFEYISEKLNIADSPPPILFDDTPAVIESAKAVGWKAYEFLNSDSLQQSPFVKEFLVSGGGRRDQIFSERSL